MDKKDIVLKVVSSFGESDLSPVKLQKSLFLVGQSGLADLPVDYYKFIAYDYGPFCKEVYDDINALERQGFILVSKTNQRSFPLYVTTEAGKDVAASINISEDLALYISQVVEWMKPLNFSQLVSSIYRKFPSYSTNSVFQY